MSVIDFEPISDKTAIGIKWSESIDKKTLDDAVAEIMIQFEKNKKLLAQRVN